LGKVFGAGFSATTAVNRLELIVLYANEARRVVSVKKTYTLERVLSKLEDVLGFPVEIKVKGKPVEEQSVWAEVVARHSSADPLEVSAEREDPNKIHKEV
jgi:hypothetical protein